MTPAEQAVIDAALAEYECYCRMASAHAREYRSAFGEWERNRDALDKAVVALKAERGMA